MFVSSGVLRPQYRRSGILISDFGTADLLRTTLSIEWPGFYLFPFPFYELLQGNLRSYGRRSRDSCLFGLFGLRQLARSEAYDRGQYGRHLILLLTASFARHSSRGVLSGIIIELVLSRSAVVYGASTQRLT